MVRYQRERMHRPELPERELLPADYWDQHEVQHWSDGLLVAIKQPWRGVAIQQVLRACGWFFVWGPDVEEFFGDKSSAPQPQQQPQEDEPQRPAVRRAKELMAAVFPNDEFRTMKVKVVWSACAPEAKIRQIPLPSPDSFSRAMGRRSRK